MMVTLNRFILLLLVGTFFGFFAACNQSGELTPLVSTEVVQVFYTSAAETVYAGLTETALSRAGQGGPGSEGIGISTFTPWPTWTPTPKPSPATPTALPTVPDTETPTAEILPTNTQRSANAETGTPPFPVVTPTIELAALPGGEVVFTDDFGTNLGWYSGQGEGFSFEYTNGSYQVSNNLAEASVRSIRSMTFADVFLEVDATPVDGPNSGFFGLVCRFVDETHYYALVIGADGFSAINRIENGNTYFLVSDTSGTSPAFNESGENRIGAACIGNRLTLYVNNQLVLDVEDETYESGNIGIVVGTRQESGLLVRFDNFQIIIPEP